MRTGVEVNVQFAVGGPAQYERSARNRPHLEITRIRDLALVAKVEPTPIPQEPSFAIEYVLEAEKPPGSP